MFSSVLSHLGLRNCCCSNLNLSCLSSGWSLDSCLAACVLPMGSRSLLTWYDDVSSKGLVADLGTGIRIIDIFDNKTAPLVLIYPEAAPAVSLSLIKYSCHFDTVCQELVNRAAPALKQVF